jgi:hypothetical protein
VSSRESLQSLRLGTVQTLKGRAKSAVGSEQSEFKRESAVAEARDSSDTQRKETATKQHTDVRDWQH